MGDKFNNIGMKVRAILLNNLAKYVFKSRSFVRLCNHCCCCIRLLWLPYVIGQTIIFLPCSFFLPSIFFLFLAKSQWPQVGCLPYFETWCGPSANLECRSERSARGSLQMQDPKKSPKWPSGHHPTTLSGYIFAPKACIDNRKKNLLSSNISPTCPHNMLNLAH